jgi:nucleoside permease NupC
MIYTIEMIPNQGMSLESISRGVMGMLVLILIAYALSNDRKNIPWKVVGLGLLAQLTIAIGVIKIAWIKSFFEYIGGFFVKLLEYTQAGTQMLLGEFGDVDHYGFIFVFQALPIIIFFSALTSLLYYFGIIQKLVQALAWGLRRLLGISGGGKFGRSWKYLFGTNRGSAFDQGLSGKNDPIGTVFDHGGRYGHCGGKCHGRLYWISGRR